MSDLRSAGPFRSAIHLAMAGLFAWGVAAALGSSVSGWVLAAMALLAVLEAEASWRVFVTSSLDRGQRRLIRLVEIVLAFLAAKLLHLIVAGASGVEAEGLFDGETIAAWLLAMLVWIATTNNIADLERLGDPPQSSPGYRPPLTGLIRRFFAGVVVLVAIGATSVVSVADLTSFERSAVATWFWPAAAYLAMGLLVLGIIRRQDTRLRWERERVEVEPDVQARWAASLTVVLLLAILAAVSVPVLGGGTALDATFGGAVAVGRWFRDLSAPGTDGAAVGPVRTIPPRPPTTEAAPAAEEVANGAPGIIQLVVMVSMLALALLLLASLIAVLRRGSPRLRRLVSRGTWRGILRLLWLAVSSLLRLIIRAIQALLSWYRRVSQPGLVHPGRQGLAQERGPDGVESRWGVGDPSRVEIGRMYGQFLDRAGRVLRPKRAAQTPTEYSAQVGQVVPSGGVEGLTATFNDARYSTHPLGSHHVASARRDLEAATAALDALEEES